MSMRSPQSFLHNVRIECNARRLLCKATVERSGFCRLTTQARPTVARCFSSTTKSASLLLRSSKTQLGIKFVGVKTKADYSDAVVEFITTLERIAYLGSSVVMRRKRSTRLPTRTQRENQRARTQHKRYLDSAVGRHLPVTGYLGPDRLSPGMTCHLPRPPAHPDSGPWEAATLRPTADQRSDSLPAGTAR